MSQNNSAQDSEQAPNYDVTFFAVNNKTKIENCTYTDFISPYFETREQALGFKAQAIAEYPECFIAKHVSEYDSKDDRNRLELLAKIVKATTKVESAPEEQTNAQETKADLGVLTLANGLFRLWEVAANNLSTEQLEFFAEFTEAAETASRNLADVVQDIGCLLGMMRIQQTFKAKIQYRRCCSPLATSSTLSTGCCW